MNRYFIYKKEICPRCDGMGKKIENPFSPVPPICHSCHGEGFLYIKVDLTKEILEEILGNDN